MEWKNLLSGKRLRESNVQDSRNPFECDYDRIVGSSSVRRLQDKAQVFPLQENDFPRTRLTHSIEVSAIACSLGKQVGKKLEEKNVFTRAETEKLEALLQTIGLIHDLGNPPFGHFGEEVIRNWFKKYFASNDQKTELTENQQKEFIYFDGNVQNLRIVTKLQMMNDKNGANFSFGTLAALMKYPYSASVCDANKDKFGYFESEEDIVKKVWSETGLREGIRHPATYLMEAADDIAYICDDIEDGVKKKYINWDLEYVELKEKFSDKNEYKEIFSKCDRFNNELLNNKMVSSEQISAKVRYFRNLVQSFLIGIALEEFDNYYDDIMSGKYQEKDLLQRNCGDIIKNLKDITAKNCFSNKEVLTLEVMGHKVISTLLDVFVDELLQGIKKCDEKGNLLIKGTKHYSGKLFELISPNFKYICLYDKDDENDDISRCSEYEILHLVVDYISGMTDSYALSLYKELMGIEISLS